MLICLVGADLLLWPAVEGARECKSSFRSDLIEMKSCSADSSGGLDWADWKRIYIAWGGLREKKP